MCVNADNQRFEVVFLDGLTVAYEAISVSKSYKMIHSGIFFSGVRTNCLELLIDNQVVIK